MIRKRQTISQYGLTLIELVIVIVIISIVSGVAGSKLGSTSATVAVQAEQFAAHVRHAQNIALNWGCELTLAINTASYNLVSRIDYTGTDKASRCGDGATILTDPASHTAFNFLLSNGIQFTATGAIYFDSLGRPTDATGTPVTTTTSFTLSGGSNNWQVSVTPVTGFVTLVSI